MEPLNEQSADAIRKSLAAIVVGALFLLIDVHAPSWLEVPMWRSDFFLDAIGMLFVLFGVVRLARFDVESQYTHANFYGSAMTFASLGAVVGLADAILAPWIPIPAVVGIVIRLVELLSIASFAAGMKLLAESRGLTRASAAWDRVTFLFLIQTAAIAVLHNWDSFQEFHAIGGLTTRFVTADFERTLQPQTLILMLLLLAWPSLELIVTSLRTRRDALSQTVEGDAVVST